MMCRNDLYKRSDKKGYDTYVWRMSSQVLNLTSDFYAEPPPMDAFVIDDAVNMHAKAIIQRFIRRRTKLIEIRYNLRMVYDAVIRENNAAELAGDYATLCSLAQKATISLENYKVRYNRDRSALKHLDGMRGNRHILRLNRNILSALERDWRDRVELKEYLQDTAERIRAAQVLAVDTSLEFAISALIKRYPVVHEYLAR